MKETVLQLSIRGADEELLPKWDVTIPFENKLEKGIGDIEFRRKVALSGCDWSETRVSVDVSYDQESCLTIVVFDSSGSQVFFFTAIVNDIHEYTYMLSIDEIYELFILCR